MRKTLKKLSRLKQAGKHLPSMNGSKINKVYVTTVRKVKRHPLTSLGTAALAIGAISGVVAWLRHRR